MGFFEWHNRATNKLSSSNISLVLIGKSLIILILGTFFLQSLSPYTVPLLFLGFLCMLPTWLNMWASGLKKKQLNYSWMALDAVGKFFPPPYLRYGL